MLAIADAERIGLIMSEPFRPYEKLVDITIYGKKFQVPERNSLLRCFQFISPETIPYGRFCWNQECQYCKVQCQLPDEDTKIIEKMFFMRVPLMAGLSSPIRTIFLCVFSCWLDALTISDYVEEAILRPEMLRMWQRIEYFLLCV